MYPDSYGDKLWFISIHIGSKYQQGNVTPDYIRLGMWSSWNQTSNSLAWKIKLPTYPSSLRDASNVRSSGNSLTTLYISPVPSLEYSRDNCTVMNNFNTKLSINSINVSSYKHPLPWLVLTGRTTIMSRLLIYLK